MNLGPNEAKTGMNAISECSCCSWPVWLQSPESVTDGIRKHGQRYKTVGRSGIIHVLSVFLWGKI